jgi:hypothetical protein
MALQKQLQFNNGTEANYWKVVSIDIDLTTGSADVMLRGYVSEQIRQSNVRAGIRDKKINVVIPQVDGNLIEQAYTEIKETPTFADATNV